jgi:RimJ/RimL family protein N-acetyltransferase
MSEPGRRSETERLALRTLTPDDFDALFSYQSRSDVARYLYWGPRTKDEVRVSLEKKLASTAIRSEEDVLSLAVVLKTTNEMVGDFILQLLSEEHHVAEIGFIIHPDYHGRGYATEAGRAVLGIAFEELELHRVIGRTEVRNVASARVLEKLGMRREAHFVENEFVKGEWQSELVYAILDREWWGREPRSAMGEEPYA